ncbi:MAG: DUF2452 domain-containing protein [Bacteroidetes bacterium]|nr:MAG: DUF2452 domain-containing protein [Bacteroidota bacterium]
MSEEKNEKEFINPIDKDKITETPHTLPYAHHVGSAKIKPVDKGKLKHRAHTAMEEQTKAQLSQIYEQMELLAKQAERIKQRMDISNIIYNADINFEPLIGHIYHLYKKADGSFVLSMIARNEWGKKCPYESFVASVKLLADHTWEVVEGDLQ